MANLVLKSRHRHHPSALMCHGLRSAVRIHATQPWRGSLLIIPNFQRQTLNIPCTLSVLSIAR
ncbi:hypothetical protein GGI35DRAFT_436459 [Trichoderma velutinum]